MKRGIVTPQQLELEVELLTGTRHCGIILYFETLDAVSIAHFNTKPKTEYSSDLLNLPSSALL
jgi:hypothetical protein